MPEYRRRSLGLILWLNGRENANSLAGLCCALPGRSSHSARSGGHRVRDYAEVDLLVRDRMGLPWGAPLSVDAATGKAKGEGKHLAWAGSWSFLDALEGFEFDVPKGKLTLTPRVPAEWKTFSAPIFGPSIEALIDYQPGLRRSSLTFQFDRFIQAAEKPTKGQPGSDLVVRQVELPPFVSNAEITAVCRRSGSRQDQPS